MPREDGVLQVDHLGRYSTRFAIGSGPFAFTSPAAVDDAQQRLEESGEGTVLLAGYWVDESDLEALR